MAVMTHGDRAPVIQAVPPLPQSRRTPRRVSTWTPEDWAALGGSLLASFVLVTILYDHLLALSGILGFLVCWWAAFLGLFAAATSLAHPRPVIADRLAGAVLWSIALVLVFAVGSVVVYTFLRGWSAYRHVNFFTRDASGTAPDAPLDQGGALHAIVGTVVEVGIGVAISLPLGIGTAVYMSEIGGRLARVVRTVVDAMTALPEILAGLFVYVALVVGLQMPKSGLAVSIAMAVTMVPIIARAAEVQLRVVPQGLREASMALGSTRWRTVRKVVLPTAKAGLATGVILGIARGVGETAIPLILSGASSYLTFDPHGKPMNSLPLFIFTMWKTQQPNAIVRGFGAASVLLLIVGVLFFFTRLLTRNRTVSR